MASSTPQPSRSSVPLQHPAKRKYRQRDEKLSQLSGCVLAAFFAAGLICHWSTQWSSQGNNQARSVAAEARAEQQVTPTADVDIAPKPLDEPRNESVASTNQMPISEWLELQPSSPQPPVAPPAAESPAIVSPEPTKPVSETVATRSTEDAPTPATSDESQVVAAADIELPASDLPLRIAPPQPASQPAEMETPTAAAEVALTSAHLQIETGDSAEPALTLFPEPGESDTANGAGIVYPSTGAASVTHFGTHSQGHSTGQIDEQRQRYPSTGINSPFASIAERPRLRSPRPPTPPRRPMLYEPSGSPLYR